MGIEKFIWQRKAGISIKSGRRKISRHLFALLCFSEVYTCTFTTTTITFFFFLHTASCIFRHWKNCSYFIIRKSNLERLWRIEGQNVRFRYLLFFFFKFSSQTFFSGGIEALIFVYISLMLHGEVVMNYISPGISLSALPSLFSNVLLDFPLSVPQLPWYLRYLLNTCKSLRTKHVEIFAITFLKCVFIS